MYRKQQHADKINREEFSNSTLLNSLTHELFVFTNHNMTFQTLTLTN